MRDPLETTHDRAARYAHERDEARRAICRIGIALGPRAEPAPADDWAAYAKAIEASVTTLVKRLGAR